MNAAPLRCSIFCAIVDNFGDIGVCWRLARQLVREYGVDVTLWVDDPDVAARVLQRSAETLPDACVEGVEVRAWSSSRAPSDHELSTIVSSDLLIEAFACALPEALLAALGKAAHLPVWVNLEYLSAESWVEEHHLLASLLSLPGRADPVQKTFFFPGFSAGTGGLLRESDLLVRHAQWQRQEQQERQKMLATLAPGAGALQSEDLVLVSLFTYESESLPACLTAMAQDTVPTLCLVPERRSLTSIQHFLDQPALLRAGEIVVRGALSIAVIPFLAQDDYDKLLSLCDFNFVRGEDSFVRAQWAARPFLWHIYPQQGHTHLQKLDAFLALQGALAQHETASQAASSMALRQFVRFWNLGEDCGELWHHLRPQLPGLRQQARKWQQHLAEMPDLAASLMRFYRSRSR